MFKRGFNQGQVDGINADIFAWSQEYTALVSLRELAYILATDYHETARTMRPIEEFGKGRGRKYGRAVGRFLKKYYGRGKVQLTWLRNYIFAGKKLSVDLEQFPEKALEMEHAVRILIQGCAEGWFTSKKLSDFKSFTGMRRVVNGTDRAQLIAGHAEEFYEALTEAYREGPAPSEPTDNSNEVTPMKDLFEKIGRVGKNLLGAATGKAGTTTILTTIASILGIEAAGGDVPGIAADLMKNDFGGWLLGTLGAGIATKKTMNAVNEVNAEDEAEIMEVKPLSEGELQNAIKDVLSGSGTEDDLDDFSMILADLTSRDAPMDQTSFLKGLNMGAIMSRHSPLTVINVSKSPEPAKG